MVFSLSLSLSLSLSFFISFCLPCFLASLLPFFLSFFRSFFVSFLVILCFLLNYKSSWRGDMHLVFWFPFLFTPPFLPNQKMSTDGKMQRDGKRSHIQLVKIETYSGIIMSYLNRPKSLSFPYRLIKFYQISINDNKWYRNTKAKLPIPPIPPPTFSDQFFIHFHLFSDCFKNFYIIKLSLTPDCTSETNNRQAFM